MYEAFAKLDGSHPWRDVSPGGFVDYPARHRPGGSVLYFNYALAAELGLIGKRHPRRMNDRLERAILDAFAIQIINEYDHAHPECLGGAKVKPGKYMATRYLQIQHKSRQGHTSGDGRAVWNGVLRTAKLTFDVSSRGTGVTCLSPGAQKTDGPLRTGDDTVGYSSGLADLDEMVGTAVMSEIFYQQGYPTERTLAVIDFGDGTAIGVRTAPNLIRPAHLFRFLKQGRREELKRSWEYFLRRQEANGFWRLPREGKARGDAALRYLAKSYAKLAAVLEEEYIFNWLSWDGDNMLASGAILDYGSVRQFAARHDRYRYDDVERFSTCLTEQKYWARELVKVFAQLADFVMTGRKRNLRQFASARCLKVFDASFERERNRRLLWRVGFEPGQIERLLRTARHEIGDFRRALAFFEGLKVGAGVEELADGITHRPVFLIRNVLRRLPAYYVSECAGVTGSQMPPELFCGIMAASYATKGDLRMTPTRVARAKNFQSCYQRLLAAAGPYQKALRTVTERSAVINREHRMTGDGLIWIVNEVIELRGRIRRDDLQEALDAFINSQVLLPGRWRPIPPEAMQGDSLKAELFRRIADDLEQCKETV
jgi:uncharacterized protein YdiU (UPF0061 family)